MIYRKFQPMPRTELELNLSSGDLEKVYEALMSAVYHDEDWSWVQEQCHRFIDSPDRQLRVGAIQGLGLIAVFRRQLDAGRAVAALTEVLKDPDVRGEAEDALDDIRRVIATSRPN
jgi:hypothetical protein